ncbi:MAG: hypothetical protein H6598_10220 [Flavobacteriales bacterium]|nr:hypothetical protein [Flavobacteriales bacterium]
METTIKRLRKSISMNYYSTMKRLMSIKNIDAEKANQMYELAKTSPREAIRLAIKEIKYKHINRTIELLESVREMEELKQMVLKTHPQYRDKLSQ